MAEYSKIKVLAAASGITLKRLNARIEEKDDIAVNGVTELDKIIDCLQKEKFDVLMIDSLMPEADLICLNLAAIPHPPIVVMVRENAANWQTLGLWQVDGFVSEESSKVELLARLKAISRRKSRDYLLQS